MNVLVFDTETTGLFDYSQPLNFKSQPYIVQLAALLANEDGDTISELNVIVEPDNWSVPTGAAEVHGIPTELAQSFGVPFSTVARMFMDMCKKANFIVGHNVNFDIDMFRRYSSTPDNIFLDDSRFQIFDTMHAATNVCKIPLTERQVAAKRAGNINIGAYKSPKLQEAHVFFFGNEFDGAHNAMADVEATKRVFFEELSLNLFRDGLIVR